MIGLAHNTQESTAQSFINIYLFGFEFIFFDRLHEENEITDIPPQILEVKCALEARGWDSLNLNI